MDSVTFQNIITDNSLIISIIAINMTIIGLTSLAETKKIIGVDYGKFLIKKYKVFNLVRIYELLIIFAVINVLSLFFMFVQNIEFRFINFLFLLTSLVFAIYYFFSYIISENGSVKKQIYEDELYGMYFASDSFDHQEADVLTEMSGGSRTSKKLSSNIINYFNTFNNETQFSFEEIFGPSSLLYTYSKRAKRKLRRKYNIAPYVYRTTKEGIHDISYEYFQMFRASQQQDKWTLDILRLFDGDRLVCPSFTPLRLYNFARVITHINLFGHNDLLYRYKFQDYLLAFYYKAVRLSENEKDSLDNFYKVKEIEKYTFIQVVHFLFNDENSQRDSVFKKKAAMAIHNIVLQDAYQGILQTEDLLRLFLKETLEMNHANLKDLFTELLNAYYQQMEDRDIPLELEFVNIKEYIESYQSNETKQSRISVNDLFGRTEDAITS